MNTLLETRSGRVAGLLLGMLVLTVCFICSIAFGVANISPQTIIQSFTTYDASSQQHLIIQTARLPRALIAATVGASLAVAGALMQGITRNPLASPSIFGINAGAAFFIVISSAFFGVSGLSAFASLAFVGAAFTATLVYVLGSIGNDGLTPLKITLAGSALTAFFSSLSLGVLLTGGQTFDQVLYWFVGSVAGRDMSIYEAAAPFMLFALIGAFFLARHMNVLALGDDIAVGLGQKTIYIKLIAGILIVLLAGGSVSMAGPIAFIGIIIPHLVRYMVGIDYRWLIPYCAIYGGILLLAADIGSRYIAFPKEVPVGVMTAILGIPFFVYIARQGGRS
ncbi:FecCD family ABC transporter permease [Paenibacillus harenae]|uniref:Iron complex transport system permease protein n=1 Tax=Paenibacillus harenae TaxID=306543 RepID=A0ABT9U6D8_PAEHA|nr:iron ABC transporter permease [Paenibacillus harenae]MDQ0060582.1 iron complex transport system permease protein [Paenibacillus harenae]MDQ0115200.1 iron complex transport system permease protein [Paenibacillus harenae]